MIPEPTRLALCGISRIIERRRPGVALVSFTPKSRAALLAVVAALVLAGCGRRGDLEPPPNPNAVQTPANSHDFQTHRTDQKIVPPKKAFVLDPLLQ
jgi:predicted small lipoprotein YifL